METIKSKNPCPFCGKKEWLLWHLIDGDNEWKEHFSELAKYSYQAIDVKAIVDWVGHSQLSAGFVYLVDECASCGALIQG